MLKTDLHIHTDSDPKDRVLYSNHDIINLAAGKGYEVLSITNHNVITYDEELSHYALERGILLIPGVELDVERKHLILINARPEHLAIKTFEDLRAAKEEELLIIAPHPFFPKAYCLNGQFQRQRDLFDAVEFSHFYHPLVNYNRKAVQVCSKYGIPMVGSSDTHMIRQFNTTWTLVDAPKDTQSVVDAIRAGKVELVTQPLSLLEFAVVGWKISHVS